MTAIIASTVGIKTMADEELYRRLVGKMTVSTSGCWEWSAGLRTNGYGAIQYKRKNTLSHRAMIFSLFGPLNKNQFVCHKCDNKKCINPDHLFVGTALDNNRDRAEKNRSHRPVGELNVMAKISDSEAAEIARCYLAGATSKELMEKHSICYHTLRSYAKKYSSLPGNSCERNGRAKLTNSDVASIREKLASGMSQMALSREFGVSGFSIWRIANNKGWK